MTTADRAAAAGLLADVYANPRDPTPRLVYADWCEDNGHPGRAEFIRLMLAGETNRARDMLRCRPPDVVWPDLLGLAYPDERLAVSFDEPCPTGPPFSARPGFVITVSVRSHQAPARWVQRGHLHGGFFEGWDLVVTNLLANLGQYLAESPLRGVRLLPGRDDRRHAVPLWQAADVGRLERLDLSAYFRNAIDHDRFLVCRHNAFRPWRGLGELTLPARLRRDSPPGASYWLRIYRDLLPGTDVTFAEGP